MLDGKKIVVTGVASGIGAETARHLVGRGAEVIGMDVNPVNDETIRYVHADMAIPASIDKALDDVGGDIDALCNIAGLPPTAPPEAVLGVNFLGLRYLTEQIVDRLADGAAIVNMASLAGVRWPENVDVIRKFLDTVNFENLASFCDAHAIEGARSYFFSKELLIAWTIRNRWSWRDRGIRMNCVSPGPVDTPILPDFLATLGERAEKERAVMDRPGTPADIAPIVAFLCSDESAWIRGANLAVDGGMNQHMLATMHGLDP